MIVEKQVFGNIWKSHTLLEGVIKKIVATINDFYMITGSVPKEFTSLSPIHVNYCKEGVGVKNLDGGAPVYKLKCIEKEN